MQSLCDPCVFLPASHKQGIGWLCRVWSSRQGLWEGSQMSLPQAERGCQASAGMNIETIWNVNRALGWSPHPWHKDEEGRSVTVSLRKPQKKPGEQSSSSSLAQRRSNMKRRPFSLCPTNLIRFEGKLTKRADFPKPGETAWRRKEF